MWEGTVLNKNIYSKECWRKTKRKIKKKNVGGECGEMRKKR